MSILYYLFLLAAVLWPSSNLQVFNGMPASGLPEFAAVLLVASSLFFPALRESARTLAGRFRIPAGALWAAAALVVGLKTGLLVSAQHTGFVACYSSPAEPVEHFRSYMPRLECERSYENAFGVYPGTRLEETVRYTADSPTLVFLNTMRYDYYDWLPGSIIRKRLPVDARWTADMRFDAPARASFEYAGEITVLWQGETMALPVAYEAERKADVELAAGTGMLEIRYRFDDGSRSGQIERMGPNGILRSEIPAAFRVSPWALAAAVLADLFVLVLLASLLVPMIPILRPDWIALAAAGIWLVVCARVPVTPLIREAGILLGLFGLLVWHHVRRPFRKETWYVLAVTASVVLMWVWLDGWNRMAFRSAGNDSLGFESQAYAILSLRSLEGGESVFYAQPLYRYVKFLEHLFFGDGDVLYAAVLCATLLGGWFRLVTSDVMRLQSRLRRIFWMGLAGSGLLFLGYYGSEYIRVGLPEYVTWIAALWCIPLLMSATRTRFFLLGSLGLAVAFLTRVNQLPACMWLLGLASLRYWKVSRPVVLAGWIILLGAGLLPLAHNLFYGGQWVWFTTSSDLAGNMPLSPGRWLDMLQGDPAAGAAVREQLSYLFLVAPQPKSLWPTLAGMAGFALFWLVTCGQAVRARRWMDLAWLLAPLAYLAPHLLFVVQTYYPRHIAIGYLSMAVVSAAVWIQSARESSAKIPDTA